MQSLGVCRKEGEDRLYPVTLAQMERLREQFPPKLFGRSFVKGQEEKHGQEVFRIQDLVFHYQPDTPVIEHLDLCLDERPTAIIGQNGAGKTTLVKLLKGLLKPDSGSIFFEGEDISIRTVAQLAGKVGYVFQNPDDQIFKNRVMEEVMVGPLNLGKSREEAKKSWQQRPLRW